MVLFHSYVSLPEGNLQLTFISGMGGWTADLVRQTLLQERMLAPVADCKTETEAGEEHLLRSAIRAKQRPWGLVKMSTLD